MGTLVALLGLGLTAMFMFGSQPSSLARFTAIGTLVSLGISVLWDLQKGPLNLVRADLMAAMAFYFLTLFEFMFPQPDFDDMIAIESTRTALYIVLVGMASLLIGRHLIRPRRQPFETALTSEIPSIWLTTIFWGCLVVGFAHMMVAVDFDFMKMIDYFMAPRFSQPWSRGRLGDWKALFVELGMLIYLIPPLGGIILARRHRYRKDQIFTVSLGLLFVFFYGFSGGTRNIFAAYLVTFYIGYAFALPPERRGSLLPVGIACAVAMFFATFMMLQFRSIGMKNWLTDAYGPKETAEQTLFVDYNLYAIAKLAEVFPHTWAYLGWEIPYQALIRPIPRAIWSGKPEGLSSTIEDALGVEGLTISASFAGEAYMSGGFVGVILGGLFFGAITGWWSFLSSPRNSELGILTYASGFFAAVISMRSLLVFTTALLPTLAAIVICIYLARVVAPKAKEFVAKMLKPRRPPPRPPVQRPPARGPRP